MKGLRQFGVNDEAVACSHMLTTKNGEGAFRELADAILTA